MADADSARKLVSAGARFSSKYGFLGSQLYQWLLVQSTILKAFSRQDCKCLYENTKLPSDVCSLAFSGSTSTRSLADDPTTSDGPMRLLRRTIEVFSRSDHCFSFTTSGLSFIMLLLASHFSLPFWQTPSIVFVQRILYVNRPPHRSHCVNVHPPTSI